MNWEERRLDELGFVGRGKSRHRPRNDPSLYGGEYPFIQTADIASAPFRICGFSQTYNEKGLAQSKLWTEPTLCMTIAGENTAKTAILDFPACFPDSIVGFIPDPEQSDLRFVKYALDQMKRKYRAVSKGATQDNLSLAKILAFPLLVPPVEEQERIANVLGNYEDLIENNQRRIALLEEAAQQLYKEWFVRFRFPGHEHVPVVDGVPEGWEATTASQAMDILSGGTPKTAVDEFWNGDIPFFTPKDTTESIYVGNSEKTLTERGLETCASRLFEKNTLFITARGTVGKLNLAQRPMAMNQSCYALVAKEPLNQFFLYFALDAAIQQFKARAVGAVFDAIIKDTFNAIPFVVPPEKLVQDFTEVVAVNVAQIDNLISQTEKLKEARDILLPRLMSGEVSV